ncbi:MAG: Glu-tRNA(Gln) amidotransferase GatDE subunit E [Candidatus Neomarinimicrobiota bacterium]|nr:MAG: Glu-tRNA(Gln) amidotransferase GatDE subunit E [Candidatus Neomarinimicrobiota bacterium]
MTPEFLKPFSEMTPEDYRELGLKAGLEIHQQLLTEKKLFCRCPAGRYSEQYDAEILRHMRPTLSELGEYDGTALMEFKTKKNIIYRINHETVCTYEMDDTPPFEINSQALDIAFQIAMLMNYKLVNEIHIARKQYLDGSIPTGFQRTTIVGVDGWIPYKGRKIGLIQLGLEEDACREVSDIGHERIYLTDRLGMPLIETVTEPVLHTPQAVADVANILRWLVRSTGKVRTGIGAARQDVNVSITGGTRIEIKGVPRIPLIPLLIYNEAMRQYALLQIRAELKKRGITEKSFQAVSKEVTNHLTQSSWAPIAWAIKHGEKVYCVNLKGFRGILSTPTQTGKVFSKEIADRVRVIACLTRIPNILTSESTEETISSFAWKKIRRMVKANSHDALVLVWGNEQDVNTAVKEIIIRAREATIGVPSETRQALADGTNGFERILPGPERMYPDTDLPPLEMTAERVRELVKNNPEPPWEREKRYKKTRVPEHLHQIIMSSPLAKLFDKIIKDKKLPVSRVSGLMFEKTRHWKRQGLNLGYITEDVWLAFFETAKTNPAILEIGDRLMTEFLKVPGLGIDTLLGRYSPPKLKLSDIDRIIRGSLNEEIREIEDTGKRIRYLMGLVMDKCRGHIPAVMVLEKVRQYIQNEKESV